MSLDVEGLSVAYGRTPVIERAAMTLETGTLCALIGPNGVGKSTLLKAIAGLLPAVGRISLEGAVLADTERRGGFAYMPQDLGPNSSLTGLEVVLLGRLRSLGLSVPRALCDAAAASLEQFGLAGLQGRSLDEMSGGQRQLTYLAQALFREPAVLLLDEPTAALDLRHQLLVLEAVRAHAARSGTIVILAMHDLSLAAQFADRMICLDGGRIEADGPPEAVLTVARLRRVYGVEAEVTKADSGALRIVPLRASSAGSDWRDAVRANTKSR